MKKILPILFLCLILILVSCSGQDTPRNTTDSGGNGEQSMEIKVQDLTEYTIVVNNEVYTQDAKRLANNLKAVIGKKLDVVGSSEDLTKVINYGTKTYENAWEYCIDVSGEEITLYGAGTAGALHAADMFISLLNEKGAVCEGEYSYSIKDLLRADKTYAMQKFFDEDGVLIDGGVENPQTIYASIKEVPAYIQASDPIVIVFLGASNTEGGKAYFELFANALANLLHKNVVYYNGGVGGTGTTTTMSRFYHSAGQYAPDIIVYDCNSNDAGGQRDTQIYSTESVMYQIQQLDKIPVVIYNWIPRPADIGSEMLKKTETMLENKTSVTLYYGISSINSYAEMRKEWELVSADIAEQGDKSTYYNSVKSALEDTDRSYKEFADFYDNFKWRKELPYMAYISLYYKLTNVKDGVINYNVHPKTSGYEFIGKVMAKKLTAEPYRYLTNRIMPEEYELSNPLLKKEITAEFLMIGADGTVIGNGIPAGTKREIVYSDGWTIYSKENKFTPKPTAENKSNSAYLNAERIIMSTGIIYDTPYFADGIAQAYNKPGASFSFKTTANQIGFYVPISGVGVSAHISVTDPDGKKINLSSSELKCYEKGVVESYARLRGWYALPGDGKEYTVTVTVGDSTLEEGKYLFRCAYIIERNFK